MKSRYDYMQPSSVRDPESGDFFPDPLTLNYHAFTLTTSPTAVELSTSQIEFFWKTTESQLGTAELDDVVLALNAIPHRNFLQAGDSILFPSVQDIEASFGANS